MKPASAIPNIGDTIIVIDKATAKAPAPMLNALEPLLVVVVFPPPFLHLWSNLQLCSKRR